METTKSQQKYTAPTSGKMEFPSSTGEMVEASSPLIGPHDYQGLAQEITKSGLGIPRPEIVSGGLFAAYCGPKSFTGSAGAQDVRNRTKKNWTYVFNVNTFTPHGFRAMAGVYSVFDKDGRGKNQKLDFNKLNKILEESNQVAEGVFLGDGVGFAKAGTYRCGKQDSESLAQDGLVVITYGPDGARDLAEVASKQFNDNAHTYAIENPTNSIRTESVRRVSALGGSSNRLHVDGNDKGGNIRAFSFGVLKVPEALEADDGGSGR